jgi:hypothetical protein
MLLRSTSSCAALLTAAVSAAPATTPAAAATGPAADKSAFNLFNPTPRELMREFNTDRPDTTESPYTVDAGHFQLEMSFIDFTRDDEHGSRTDQFAFAPANLKLGVLNNLDLQLLLEPFVRVEADDGDDASGFGVTQLRAKLNLWGNDGGDTAMALMPFVQLPTASDDALGSDHVEGGLIVPLAISLPGDWSLGLMAEFDVVRDATDDGYGIEFVHTATLGHPIVAGLAGYVEYVGVAPCETGRTYLATVAGGLTYALGEDLQLDVGVNVGVSDRAEDLNVFTGISWRR